MNNEFRHFPSTEEKERKLRERAVGQAASRLLMGLPYNPIFPATLQLLLDGNVKDAHMPGMDHRTFCTLHLLSARMRDFPPNVIFTHDEMERMVNQAAKMSEILLGHMQAIKEAHLQVLTKDEMERMKPVSL